jgi:DNA-binding NtrC family response regulator
VPVWTIVPTLVARFLKRRSDRAHRPEITWKYPPTAVNKSPHLRVLVVDDEALIRWSLVETLADAGLSAAEASDGQSAVRALSEDGPFDVVVLDYRLPDSNDLNLLATIRRLSPRTAVVMMTAFGTPEISSGALELGAYRVVPKPFDVHHMADLVFEAYDVAAAGS